MWWGYRDLYLAHFVHLSKSAILEIKILIPSLRIMCMVIEWILPDKDSHKSFSYEFNPLIWVPIVILYFSVQNKKISESEFSYYREVGRWPGKYRGILYQMKKKRSSVKLITVTTEEQRIQLMHLGTLLAKNYTKYRAILGHYSVFD